MSTIEEYTILVNAQFNQGGKVKNFSTLLAYKVANGQEGYQKMIDYVSIQCTEKLAKPHGGAVIEYDVYKNGERVDCWVSGIEVQ